MSLGDDVRKFVDAALSDQLNTYLTISSVGVFGDILERLLLVRETIRGCWMEPRPGVSKQEFKAAHDVFWMFLSAIDQPKVVFEGMANTPQRVARFTPQDRSFFTHFAEMEGYVKGRMLIDQFLLLMNTLEATFSKILAHYGYPNPDEGTLGDKWRDVRSVLSSAPVPLSTQIITNVSELHHRRNMAVHHNCRYESTRYPMAQLGSASCWSLPGQFRPSQPGSPFVMDKGYLEYAMGVVGNFADAIP